MNSKNRIAIIEDELLVSAGLQAWITRYRNWELVGCAADGEAGWNLCLAQQPDVVLADIQLPKMDGFALAQRLTEKLPRIRILLMSGLMDAHTIWRVMQSGAHGYISKTQPPEALMDAIQSVARGNTFFDSTFSRVKQEWLAQPEAFHKILSEREQQVLRGVAAGWEDDRIGTELGISPATVEAHRKRLRQKLEVHNDRGLLAYARRWGLDIQTGGTLNPIP